MFGSRGWQRFALSLNVVGTVMLFWSFQATSSNVRIVRTKDGALTALCVENQALVVGGGKGTGVGIGWPCPVVANGRAIAIVNIEKPLLVGIGFMLILVGFALQIISVPDVETIDDMRRQLKALNRDRSYNKRR